VTQASAHLRTQTVDHLEAKEMRMFGLPSGATLPFASKPLTPTQSATNLPEDLSCLPRLHPRQSETLRRDKSHPHPRLPQLSVRAASPASCYHRASTTVALWPKNFHQCCTSTCHRGECRRTQSSGISRGARQCDALEVVAGPLEAAAPSTLLSNHPLPRPASARTGRPRTHASKHAKVR
jgi:hypothetical protein